MAQSDIKDQSIQHTKEAACETLHQDGLGDSGAFDFSSMTNLLNDPSFGVLVERISNDPAFADMAKQLQRTISNSSKENQSQGHAQGYFDAMHVIMQNPQYMLTAERLGRAVIQNPEIANAIQNRANSACEDQHKPHVAHIHEEPMLQEVLNKIETEGPSAVAKYWNDPLVLSKLGHAMGVGATDILTSGEDIVAAVEDHGHEDESSVHYFASVGKLEDLKAALQGGVNGDEKDSEGRTALHFASGYGELKCVEALLEAGATIDATDEDDNTPLHYAASYGQYACVEFLLKKGASSTKQNLDGHTPLEVAQFSNQDEVSYLLGQVAAVS